MLEILTNVGFNPTANNHNCVCVKLKPCSLDGGMLMGGGSIPSVCLDNVHLCLGDTGDPTHRESEDNVRAGLDALLVVTW